MTPTRSVTTIVCILVTLIGVVLSDPGCRGQKIQKPTWDLVAVTYAIAFAYPEKLPVFVRQNSALFAPDAEYYRASELLAGQLLRQALQRPSYSETYESSMNIASEAGAPELGPKVADDINRANSDVTRVAMTLSEIARVVPALVDGDLGPYRATQTYQLATLLWQLSEQTLHPQYVRQLQDLTYKLSVWYITTLASRVE